MNDEINKLRAAANRLEAARSAAVHKQVQAEHQRDQALEALERVEHERDRALSERDAARDTLREAGIPVPERSDV